jgi:hypothetical protein
VAQGRLTRQMLADISRDRDVVSYAPGLDDLGRMFVLKLALKNGQSNVVFLPPAVAFLRESIRAASRRFRYRDVRRRIGEARSEPQIINDFLDRQPVIAGMIGMPWQAEPRGSPKVVRFTPSKRRCFSVSGCLKISTRFSGFSAQFHSICQKWSTKQSAQAC